MTNGVPARTAREELRRRQTRPNRTTVYLRLAKTDIWDFQPGGSRCEYLPVGVMALTRSSESVRISAAGNKSSVANASPLTIPHDSWLDNAQCHNDEMDRSLVQPGLFFIVVLEVGFQVHAKTQHDKRHNERSIKHPWKRTVRLRAGATLVHNSD